MTEDYKKTLLDYATSTISNTDPTNEEIILESNNVNRDLWANYLPTTWQDFRFEGMVAGNESTSGLSVIYGGYIDGDGNVKGIIILVNENFEPVKTFYNYDSGTPLRYIQYMKQAEDGTFYFIDDEVFSYTQRQQALTSQKRFVMINNLTVPTNGEYKLSLRISYIFPDAYKNFYCHNMFKDPNSSNYVFFGGGVDSNSSLYDYRLLKILGLEIKVGESNVWTPYVSQSLGLFASAFAQFNSEGNVYFRCVWSNVQLSSRDIHCYTKTYTGNPTDSTIMHFNYQPYIDEGFQKKQSVFMNIDEVYFVQNNQYWGTAGTAKPKWIGLYKHNFNNNTNETIFEKYLGKYDYTYQEYIMIDRNLTKLYIEYVNNYDRQNDKGDYYIQRYEGEWNPILIGEQQPFVSNRRSIFVKNNYNLLQFYSYPINPQRRNWFLNISKEDYYNFNYNGEPYESENALIPYKARLYSNDSIVFARDLYNISKYNNMTMSSVEIPNTYLNDVNITRNDLISETNLPLNQNTQQWTKNIYEVVDLNFLNTIRVKNEDTDIEYLESAIKLNNATTDGGSTNYQNTPCTKYRINYADDTTSIYDLSWININDYNKKTQISLYVDKEISSIDLLSDDETTIYTNIPVNLEVGKYYAINQKVRIGKKVISVDLKYNNQDVNYLSQPVKVYIEE